MAVAGNLRIRTLRSSDVETIDELSKDLGLSRWSRADLKAEIGRSDSFTLVATLGGQPVGFLLGRRVFGTDDHAFDFEIYNIGVAKKHQNSGIGSLLFRDLIERSLNQSVVNVWLEVRASNYSALRFYTKHGFEIVHTRSGFYADPVDDAVVMQLKLINAQKRFH